jgi:hypothetical protein
MLSPGEARAGDLRTTTGDWALRFTPYVWATSLRGTSVVRGHSVDVDVSVAELLQRPIPRDLFAITAGFEARNDRFAVLGDVFYARVAAARAGARSVTIDRGIDLTLGGTARIDVEQAIVELAAAYEVVRWPAAAGSTTAIDLYAGARVWWQRVGVGVAAAAVVDVGGFVFAGGRALARSGEVSWVDPIVGLRLRHDFAPGHHLYVSGDVGGFEVGSRFAWQAQGGYRFDLGATGNVVWSGLVGYRALYTDYGRGEGRTAYRFDILQHGPVIGLSARF